ncbi:hypothetical protein [Streptomyces sp. 8N706]|uniref:hypothetical protein n=1 Tax=Streptomyces sp. 8N706 TaxID=3457416 RepID=UPI003FD35D2A
MTKKVFHMRAIRSRVRTFASAGLLVTAALLATACQQSDAAGTDSGDSSFSAPAASGKAVNGTGGSSGGSSGGKGTSSGKAVNGTFTGALTYVAPGKYTVKDQMFYVAEDTEILGAGTICGDPEGQSASECTFDQLEAAVKKGGVHAEVTVVKGIATRIAEQGSAGSSGGSSGNGDAPSAKPVNGTFTGALTYLAPGKYIIKDQMFHVAENTEIIGAGTICGDPEGETSNDCTFDQLEAAVKKGGVHADVTVVNGVATRISEQP